ncbi:hypothetical protein JHK87_055156 [Glycine soja]|nr:hypothetical protein JHK87_055156 [Glycine soja]
MIILKLAQIDDLTLDEDMMNPIEKLVKYGISGLTKVCLWVKLFYTNWKAFLGIKPLGQWQLISLGRGVVSIVVSNSTAITISLLDSQKCLPKSVGSAQMDNEVVAEMLNVPLIHIIGAFAQSTMIVVLYYFDHSVASQLAQQKKIDEVVLPQKGISVKLHQKNIQHVATEALHLHLLHDLFLHFEVESNDTINNGKAKIQVLTPIIHRSLKFLLSLLALFMEALSSSTSRKMVSPKQVWMKIGYIHDLFPKAFHQNLKHVVSEIMKDKKVSFNLQDILCRMQEF